MVELVRQRFGVDCGICCIAMATALPYERVFMAAPLSMDSLEYGLTFREMLTTMRRLGQPIRWHWPEGLSPNRVGAPLRELVRGKNAIHLVPSISRPDKGCFHYVLVHEGVIYDPSPKRKRVYRSYEQLRPLGAIRIP